MTTPTTLIVTQSFTDAEAALAHAATIYTSGINHLRQSLQDFVAGAPVTGRIRACYPFVRVRTDTVARADSRLSYGFVAGPGVYETTLTRPDLFASYFREQFQLLLQNHGGPLEVGMSKQPIPIHFSFAQHDHVEGTMSPERRQQVDHIGHGAVCVAGAVRLQPAAQHDKQLVHQRQLLPGLVGSIAWQVVEQGRQLPVQGLGQRLARRRVQRCHIGTVGTDRGQGPGQAVGQQLVVQAVGECHRGTAGVLARVTRSIGLAIVGAGRLARFVPGCHAPPLAGGLPFAIRLQQLLTATVTPLRDNRP